MIVELVEVLGWWACGPSHGRCRAPCVQTGHAWHPPCDDPNCRDPRCVDAQREESWWITDVDSTNREIKGAMRLYTDGKINAYELDHLVGYVLNLDADRMMVSQEAIDLLRPKRHPVFSSAMVAASAAARSWGSAAVSPKSSKVPKQYYPQHGQAVLPVGEVPPEILGKVGGMPVAPRRKCAYCFAIDPTPCCLSKCPMDFPTGSWL